MPIDRRGRSPAGRFDRRLSGLDGWSGRLEQVFHSAAVARPDGEGLPGLTLLSEQRDLVPYSVQVPWQTWRPAPGDRLSIQDGRMELRRGDGAVWILPLDGPSESLILEGEGPADLEVLRQQVVAPVQPERSRRLLSSRPAFDGSLAERECVFLVRGLQRLVEGWWLRGRIADLDAALDALVGFGSGSTPSGDDLLVASLAAGFRFSACGWLPAGRLPATIRQLRRLPTGRTTPLSAETMGHACQGCFCAPLKRAADLLAAPGGVAAWPGACRQLTALGAQSGADMLAGLLWLARAVMNDRTGVNACETR